MLKANETIQLQGIGLIAAMKVEDLKEGVELCWNYSYGQCYVKFVEQTSKCYYTLTEVDIKTGKEYSRKKKIGSVVGVVADKNDIVEFYEAEQTEASNTTIKTDAEPQQEKKIENCKCAFGYCKEYKEGKDCKKCSEITKSQGFTGCVFATDKENISEGKKVKTESESQPEQKPETIVDGNTKPITADDSQHPSKNISEYFTIEKKLHEKKNIDIWVCRLIDKLSKDNFYKLNEEIKALGGYYSKFASVKGFVFKKDPTELLNNSNIDVSIFSGVTDLIGQQQESQEKIYPEINIDDIGTYTIDKQLSKRENDNAMFRNNPRDHQKEIQEIFQSANDNILELINLNCSSYIEYKAKQYVQSFKKKYYELYKRVLYHKANNPSWAVTGRSGLNVNRYNKKQDQLMNMERELCQLIDDFNSKIDSFKRKIDNEQEQELRNNIEQNTKDINTNSLNLIRVTKQYNPSAVSNIFSNPTSEIKGYNYNDTYFVCKNWGYWRIYNKQGNELQLISRTTKNLEEAKKQLIYLLSQENNISENQAM